MIPEIGNSTSFLGLSNNKERELLLLQKIRSPKGDYEQYIFCTDCESKFSVLDDYFAKTMNGQLNDKIDAHRMSQDFIQYYGFDYKKFKLSLLSLFVRASLSTRVPFKLKFSEEHERNISDMIVEDRPGSPLEYPLRFILYNRPHAQIASNLIYPYGKNGEYCFLFSNQDTLGIIFIMNTEVDDIKDIISNYVLLEQGSIVVKVLNEDERNVLYKNIVKMPIDHRFAPTDENTVTNQKMR